MLGDIDNKTFRNLWVKVLIVFAIWTAIAFIFKIGY